MIALILPTSGKMALADTIFMEVLEGLRAFLDDRNLDLMVLLCGPEENAYAYLRRVAARGLADGLIIAETQRDRSRASTTCSRRAFPSSPSAAAQSGRRLSLDRPRFRAGRGRSRSTHLAIARPSADRRRDRGERDQLQLRLRRGLPRCSASPRAAVRPRPGPPGREQRRRRLRIRRSHLRHAPAADGGGAGQRVHGDRPLSQHAASTG